MPTPGQQRDRAVRSFVIRAGRMTTAQQRALDDLLPVYALIDRELRRSCGRQLPVELEIGIGNGGNLLAMAAANPGSNFLGSEVHRPGLGHTLLGIERLGLANVRLHDGDVVELLGALPAASVNTVHIYFPDPWPKKRHHKRRLMNAGLLARLVRVLRRGARLYFATDDADYAHAARALLDAAPEWINLAGRGHWALRPRHRILTRFEQRAGRAGTPVYELAFAVAASAPAVSSEKDVRQ